MLLATGTIVTMDRMLGDHRRDLLGDVFDDPFALPLAALQFPAAAGADFQPMLDTGIDLLRCLAAGTLVPVLRPRILPPPLVRRRLLIHRQHPRRRRRRRRR